MSELSPFYQEILSFLKSSAMAREKENGLDANADPEFKEFHALIDASLSESSKPLALQEILENYRHLFEERAPVLLELQWIRSFSRQEFEKLGLGAYFPAIYRGLPRLYHRDNPGLSRIRKNFTDLAALKKRSIDRALFSLYEGVELSAKMKVSIFAWVIPDGLGDWVAAQETAAVLHEKFPHLDIQLVLLSSRKLPYSGNDPVIELVYEKNPSIDDFSFEALKAFRESDLILQIPTFFAQSKQLWEKVFSIESERPLPLIENIGEYGFLQSDWFHPKSHNYSMGLHVLEKGIFIRKTAHCCFSEIQQKNLLHWMFGTEIPGPYEIEKYEKSHQFFLAYLATPVGGAIYLHSLLKKLEADEKHIDLCCPDLGWLIHWIENRKKQSLPILEESFGVKEIIVFAFDQSHSVGIAETGKTLRILCPGAISLSDMKKLFFLSGEWVAVRGNQSFTEAVSAGKSFFYDGREHAKYFIKDLLAFAENRLLKHRSALEVFRMLGQAFLWNLPEESGDWVDDSHFQRNEKMPWFEIAVELGVFLNDPDAIAGFKKFCLMIEQERSFNEFLCHLVQRSLFHSLHSHIRKMESLQLNLYLAGKISFSTLVKNHRIRIMQTRGESIGLHRS